MSVTPVNLNLVEKLRKILALTQSPVEGEATAAAEHLHRLLTAHNLSMADLEAKGGHHAPGVLKGAHDLGKAAFKWKLDLAERIASHYYCHPLVDRSAKTVAFIGRRENVESLTMLYGWVIDQIKRLATEARRKHFDSTGEHIDPLRWQLGFGEGAVQRLDVRLREQRAREEEDAAAAAGADSATGTALVVMGDARKREISDWLEANGEDRIDGRKTKAQEEADARYAAWRAQREAEEAAKTPEQKALEQAAYEKQMKEWAKKEAARQRRRDRYVPKGRYSSKSWATAEAEEKRDDQSYIARQSGRDNADRINLQPFIEGQTPAPTSRRIKKGGA